MIMWLTNFKGDLSHNSHPPLKKSTTKRVNLDPKAEATIVGTKTGMRYKARTYRGGNLNRNHSLVNLILTTLTPSLLICFRTTACWRNRTHPLFPLPVELPTLPSFWPSIFPFPAKKKDWKSYLFKETLTISLICVLLKKYQWYLYAYPI